VFQQAYAREPLGDVVVETYVTGNDYRCLVIGGKLAAVAERVPAERRRRRHAHVNELVEIANADPRRGIGHEKVLTRIRSTPRPTSCSPSRASSSTPCPSQGRRVKLAADRQHVDRRHVHRPHDEAHPDNVEIAETAAQVVGLDVAGIDFICPDIASPCARPAARSSRSTRRPGFRMHTHPTEGEPQYVARPVIDLLFPPGSPRASRSSP
jgi:cyanophycin synthetase